MALQRLFPDEGTQRRYCKVCSRLMTRSNIGDTCPYCLDEALYQQVKEYINQNDVTEMEVADRFDIPLSKVHTWIEKGHIEYRRPQQDWWTE